jgi:hypothetical protein
VVAPVILAVVSFIAGHPTTVACDATLNGHAASAPAGTTPIAWTPYGGSTIYVLPSICDESNATVGTEQFAHAIGTFIHEATHARGVVSESCAEMTADIGVFDVLRRFYDVPFFSSTSVLVGAEVFAFTRQRPAEYQPEACWQSGRFG